MTRFIPREKLGKKARRLLDNRQRRFWPVPPVTRVIENKKAYSRKRKSHDGQLGWYHGIFHAVTQRVRTRNHKRPTRF